MAATAILFDLDGTIWDSYPLYASLIARKSGALESLITKQLRSGTSIVNLKKQYGVSDADFVRRCAEARLYLGVREVLGELRRRQMPIAAATSLPGRLVTPMLEKTGLKDYFSVTIHAGTCRVPKPHPKSIIMALEAIAVCPSENAFYVGDLETDAAAAQNAGISFAWAAYGYGESAPNSTKVILRKIEDVLSL